MFKMIKILFPLLLSQLLIFFYLSAFAADSTKITPIPFKSLDREAGYILTLGFANSPGGDPRNVTLIVSSNGEQCAPGTEAYIYASATLATSGSAESIRMFYASPRTSYKAIWNGSYYTTTIQNVMNNTAGNSGADVGVSWILMCLKPSSFAPSSMF